MLLLLRACDDDECKIVQITNAMMMQIKFALIVICNENGKRFFVLLFIMLMIVIKIYFYANANVISTWEMKTKENETKYWHSINL